jgi:predicted peptidase
MIRRAVEANHPAPSRSVRMSLSRSRSAIVALALFIAVVFFAPAARAEAPADVRLGKVNSRSYFFKEAGKPMPYTLYVPSYYDPDVKWPLMVALHGLLSNPDQIIRYPGFTEQAEKFGYIVVAPMGYNNRGWYGNKMPFVNQTDPPNLLELSEKDVLNVLELTLGQFSVDKKRVYLMGHSMGGGGTLHLGMKYPDKWAGLAPIAPAIFGDANRLKTVRDIPTIMVQAVDDSLVPAANTRLWAAKMKQLEMTHRYVEDNDGGHILVAFRHLPTIFEFFEKHPRAWAEDAEPAAAGARGK